MDKKIQLAEIVKGQDFLREISRAADLSYEHKMESGFDVYTDEHLSRPFVNLAVLGEKHRIPTELDPEHKAEENTGVYIPLDGQLLIPLHFHPPNSELCPSYSDMVSYLESWNANFKLRASSNTYLTESDYHEECMELDLITPVAMIGLVKDDPKEIGLLLYQGISQGDGEEPVRFDDFIFSITESYEKQYGVSAEENQALMFLEGFGFPIRTKSVKKLVDFINDSGFFQAANIDIKNGKISNEDLEKLKKFELIHTKLLEEEYLDGLVDEDCIP